MAPYFSKVPILSAALLPWKQELKTSIASSKTTFLLWATWLSLSLITVRWTVGHNILTLLCSIIVMI